MDTKLIGDYIHYKYDNYITYGLNRVNEDKRPVNPADIFEQQVENVMHEARSRKMTNRDNLEKIEEQLNFFFDAKNKKDENIQTELSDADIKNMEEAIIKYFEGKLDNIIITDTLGYGGKTNGDMDLQALQNTSAQQSINRLRELFSTSKDFGKGKEISKEGIERRINELFKIREEIGKNPNNNQRLIKQIDNLSLLWNDLLSKEFNNKKQIINQGKVRSFANGLNNLISNFLTGSSTMHGEYAEAVAILTNQMVNNKGLKSIDELVEVLKKNMKGQKKTQSGLWGFNFATDFTSMPLIIKDTKYQMKDEYNGSAFVGHATQDKVDIDITFEGLNIPSSVKNYNMSNNVLKDIHFLSGRSVLALVQEYHEFVNHYLNVMSEHPDNNFGNSMTDLAHQTMKLTVGLKALAGGLAKKSRDTGGLVNTEAAELLIINDNSVGKFRVYRIEDVLNLLSSDVKRLKAYLHTGDLDNKTILDNDFVGNVPNASQAQVRISHLLNQLHSMELSVSIDKTVFNDML